MEGAIVPPKHSSVDVSYVFKSLTQLAINQKLLDFRVIRCSVLEGLTKEILDATNYHYMDTISELTNLWFPSLCAVMSEAGISWSHAFDLDLEIINILKTANYPIVDDLREDVASDHE